MSYFCYSNILKYMIKKRNIKDRIWIRISLKKGDIFLRKDFDDLGGYDQVGRALKELVSEGKIAKIGYGLYTRLKKSILTGKPITSKPLPVLAKEALMRLGVKMASSKFESDYNEGKSTQVPTGRLIEVKSRVVRKIGYEGTYVHYSRPSQ